MATELDDLRPAAQLLGAVFHRAYSAIYDYRGAGFRHTLWAALMVEPHAPADQGCGSERRVLPPVSRSRQWSPGATPGATRARGQIDVRKIIAVVILSLAIAAGSLGFTPASPASAGARSRSRRRRACLISGTCPGGRSRISPPYFTAPWYRSCSEERAGCNGVRADVRSPSRRRAGRIGVRSGPWPSSGTHGYRLEAGMPEKRLRCYTRQSGPARTCAEWQVSRPHSSDLTSAPCPGRLLARAGHRWR
jgi:hypothetical protein